MRSGPSRREFLAGIAGSLATAPARAAPVAVLRIRDEQAGHLLSPFVFGANEIGVMDGGRPSAALDREAGVTFRRLGGNLMTGYHWVTNAAHAGKNHRHSNGPFLLEALQIPEVQRKSPAAVISAMHEATLAMGAKSLITLPLAGYVSGDLGGAVAAEDAAPSARFVPVRWEGRTPARAAPDPSVCDVPHLLARLIEAYGDAGSARGVAAYALDNEPDIWFQTHPRIMPRRVSIRDFIARSITAARTIKALDPKALVFGPGSWGATGMVSFQDARDWPEYQQFGSFLGAYLDSFREASERAGMRLLDALDVHWYPFSRRGSLFRTENASLDPALLDAPRALTEAGYREDSWVSDALRSTHAEALSLPILPSLQRLIARRFAGTSLAITEFNYGGAGRLAAGLALADALGRYGAGQVSHATHWGSLDGWLKQAYRLYRVPDRAGRAFAGYHVAVEGMPSPVRAYAARAPDGFHLVIINTGMETLALDVTLASRQALRVVDTFGFDARQTSVAPLATPEMPATAGMRLVVPGHAARRYFFV